MSLTERRKMSGKRYTKEFKIEAVCQVTDRGCSVAGVAQRLGTPPHGLKLVLPVPLTM